MRSGLLGPVSVHVPSVLRAKATEQVSHKAKHSRPLRGAHVQARAVRALGFRPGGTPRESRAHSPRRSAARSGLPTPVLVHSPPAIRARSQFVYESPSGAQPITQNGTRTSACRARARIERVSNCRKPQGLSHALRCPKHTRAGSIGTDRPRLRRLAEGRTAGGDSTLTLGLRGPTRTPWLRTRERTVDVCDRPGLQSMVSLARLRRFVAEWLAFLPARPHHSPTVGRDFQRWDSPARACRPRERQARGVPVEIAGVPSAVHKRMATPAHGPRRCWRRAVSHGREGRSHAQPRTWAAGRGARADPVAMGGTHHRRGPPTHQRRGPHSDWHLKRIFNVRTSRKHQNRAVRASCPRALPLPTVGRDF